MKINHTITTAISGLHAHPSRSILTVLGIVIGIAAIILVVSVGQAAENLVLGEIQGLGSETLVVRPGREPRGPSDFANVLFENSLRERDLVLLQSKVNVPRLVDLTPIVVIPGSVSYDGETYRPRNIFGGSAEFVVDSFDIYPELGAPFTGDDIRRKTSVAVIGAKVRDELFGEADPIGEQIRIRDKSFKVVGVFPRKGHVAFLNIDEMVVVPYTTAQSYLLGSDHFQEIIVKTEGADFVQETANDINITLRNAHSISDPAKDDFHIMTQSGLVNQVKNIIGSLTVFLTFVVAVSLVVGGIGVMNIMLVSVTERTREIGLRKAIGATGGDILRQFLFEAMILTGSGGLIGIILGASLSFSASLILRAQTGLGWSFTFPVSAAALAVLISVSVGLVFGLYPAGQASKKSPIETLRYE